MLNVVRTNALFCDKMETSCQKNVAKECLYKEKDVSLHPCKLNNMNTNRTSKAFIIRAAITLLLLLLTSATAWAETIKVPYFDSNGEHEYETTATIAENAITDLGNGWYVMSGEFTLNNTLEFTQTVNLILADGAQIEINAYNGVSSDDYNGIYAIGSLTIYGQEAGTGTLTINSDKITKPGNGINAKGGNITINGGTLNISANQYGICTSKGESSSNCDITITGGRITVTATDGIDADGNITLGCRKGTDYIFASSYSNNVIIAGQTLIDGMNAYNSGTINDPSVLSSKILAPDLFGISNGNTGTSSNPYAISTGDGLQLLATYVNNGYVFSGKFFTLNDDIAFNSSTENNFTPIGGKFGKVYYSFCGSFDGDGHTISGIDIDIDDNNYAGIFGYIESEASISNVTLINASISGNEYIGGIVGDNEGGSISNCLVAKSTINGTSYTGAIVGYNSTSGTLDHNYYGNINNVSSGIGCGTANGSKDVTHNDGAVSATFLSESKDVPSPLNGKVFFYREFKGGSASTICLPFAYNPKNSDGSFYTFNHVEKKDGKWEAIMDNVSGNLAANTPYIFVPDENRNIVPILFHGDAAYASNPSTTSGYWTFKGTYEEKKWDSEPTGIYGFSAQAVADDNISQGQFVKVGAYVKIRPLRAYLEYTGSNFPNTRSSLPEEGLPDRIIVRLVGGETSIGQLDMKTGQVNLDSGWYNLDGIRLSGKPTKHGIYVHHGKKVVISTMNNE